MNNVFKNVLIIKGASQYGVMSYVCDDFMHAFCSIGLTVTMIDLNYVSYNNIKPAMLEEYDLFFSIDAIGLDLHSMASNKPLFWTFLVDPPFYLNERLKHASGNVIVSCVDRHHVEYIDKYYKNIPFTCFMPHGGITGEPLSPIPYSERKYDVVFFGSIGNPNIIQPLIDNLQKEYDEVTTPVIDEAMYDLSKDLDTIVSNRLELLGIDFNSVIFSEFMYILRPIDALRRYYKRCSLIQNLCENGIHIDVWGNGWDEFLSDNNCNGMLLNHNNINYSEVKTVMRDAKIIINDMPLFHDGSHERVFASMQSGAIAATDKSIFLEECFNDSDDIIFYDIDRIDILATNIKELLNNIEKAQCIISNGTYISQNHTWKERANLLLDISEKLIIT